MSRALNPLLLSLYFSYVGRSRLLTTTRRSTVGVKFVISDYGIALLLRCNLPKHTNDEVDNQEPT